MKQNKTKTIKHGKPITNNKNPNTQQMDTQTIK